MKKRHARPALPMLALAFLCGCQDPTEPPLPPQPVAVLTVTPHPVVISTVMPGRLQAHEIAHVRPQVTGVIQQRLFEEGDDVKAGQPLYQIDPRPYRAAYATAQGDLMQAEGAATAARAKLRRYGPLAREQAVSDQDYDDARSGAQEAEGRIQSARGTLQRAAVDLEYTKVTSPIDGRIGRSLLTVGALATTGQEQDLAIVTQLDPLYMDVRMPVRDLLRLRQEMDDGRLRRVSEQSVMIDLVLEDGSTYRHPGHIAFSEVNVDEATGTVVTRAVVPNPEHILLPGMFVHARIDEGTAPQAIEIPMNAVSHDPHGDAWVWIVDHDDRARIRPVATGRITGGNWLIEKGLEAGERVILNGFQKIQPGDRVSVTNTTTLPPASQPEGE